MRNVLQTVLLLSIIMTPMLAQQVELTRQRIFRKTVIISNNDKTSLKNKPGVYLETQNQVNTQAELQRSFVRSGLTGSVPFGFMGAMLGYAHKTHCYGSSDVLRICTGDAHATRMGLSIGSGVGTVIGFANRQKQIKKEKWFLRVLIGSAIGSVAGYYLSDIPAGFFGTFVLPPILADTALRL